MNDEHLTSDAVRPLNSREIAKIISGTLGGFLGWCDSQQVMDALEHLASRKDEYKEFFFDLSVMAQSVAAYQASSSKELGQQETAIGMSQDKVLQFILITLSACVRDLGPKGLCDLIDRKSVV